MSMITEKRNEVANKLDLLLKDRNLDIETKVKAFRTSLELTPMSEEIINTKKLLNALDEVIACEANFNKTTQVTTEEMVISEEKESKETEEVEIKTEEKSLDFVEISVNPETKETEVINTTTESRPGMAYVGIPERR